MKTESKGDRGGTIDTDSEGQFLCLVGRGWEGGDNVAGRQGTRWLSFLEEYFITELCHTTVEKYWLEWKISSRRNGKFGGFTMEKYWLKRKIFTSCNGKLLWLIWKNWQDRMENYPRFPYRYILLRGKFLPRMENYYPDWQISMLYWKWLHWVVIFTRNVIT